MALQQLVNAVVFGSVLTLFSLGLSLAWGTLDVLNLAHGSMFVFAGFVAFEITTRVHMPFALLVLCCMIATGIVAMLLELVAFRHVRVRFANKRQAELSMLVASIGASGIIDTVVANTTSSSPFAPAPSAFAIHPIDIGASVVITNIEIVIVAVAALVAVLLDQWIRRSRQGRAVRSIAYDPGVSSLIGVNVNAVAAATMFAAGALAGLAGALLAVNLGGEDVTVGQSYLLTAFAILIVGGVGNIRGAVASAYLIAIAETAVIAYGPASWSDGVPFVLILVVLIVRPNGLFSRRRFQRA